MGWGGWLQCCQAHNQGAKLKATLEQGSPRPAGTILEEPGHAGPLEGGTIADELENSGSQLAAA